ncbi:S8 family serine peptidase [candidate division WOR-3 bacterium]|nr:S8 family serine peptidase [candidate division WOR-3 bacterium]
MSKRCRSICKLLSVSLILLSNVIAQEAPDYVPGELIVKLEQGVLDLPAACETQITNIRIQNKELFQAFREYGVYSIDPLFKNCFGKPDPYIETRSGRKVPVDDLTQLYLLRFDDASDVRKVADELKRIRGVIYTSPNYLMEFFSDPPNDPDFDFQWGLDNNRHGWDLDILRAWDLVNRQDSVVLAILDSGLEPKHYDEEQDEFYGIVIEGWSPYGEIVDDNFMGHGTWVTGIAAAAVNNGAGEGGVHGIAGVAGRWKTRQSPAPMLYVTKVGFSVPVLSWVIEALLDIATHPEICAASGSWGFISSIDNESLKEAVKLCFLSEKTCFFASGNQTDTEPDHLIYPAAFASEDICCAVGAIDSFGIRWPKSCFGQALSFVAPGTSIFSTANQENGFYQYGAGTSASAPFAAGAGILVYEKALERGWHLVDVDLKRILERSARHNDPLYGTAPDPETGYGCINAWQAIRHISEPYQLIHETCQPKGDKLLDTLYVTFLDSPNQIWSEGKYLCERYLQVTTVYFDSLYRDDIWVWGRPFSSSDGKPVGYGSEILNDCVPRVFVEDVNGERANIFYYNYRILEDSSGNPITHDQWAPAQAAEMEAPYTAIATTCMHVSDKDLENQKPEIEVLQIPGLNSAIIRFELFNPAHTCISVYDASGGKVKILIDGEQPAGRNELRWEGYDDAGRSVSSGVYFVCLSTDQYRASIKMVLIK